MNLLQTNFGRHMEELCMLESLLRATPQPAYHALVIGAGLDALPYRKELEKAAALPELRRTFSWEYLEVAAMLTRLGKEWSVTVVDSSAEVCEALQRQQEVPVDDYYGKTQYAQRFLQRMGSGNDIGLAASINAALEPARITNRATIAALTTVPRQVRERITVVQGAVEALDTLQLPHERYDAIVMFNVFQYVTAGSIRQTEQAVLRRRSSSGFVTTEKALPGLHPVESIEREFWGYSDNGEIIRRREPTYVLAETQGGRKVSPLTGSS